jgi:hypothetical protein
MSSISSTASQRRDAHSLEKSAESLNDNDPPRSDRVLHGATHSGGMAHILDFVGMQQLDPVGSLSSGKDFAVAWAYDFHTDGSRTEHACWHYPRRSERLHFECVLPKGCVRMVFYPTRHVFPLL